MKSPTITLILSLSAALSMTAQSVITFKPGVKRTLSPHFLGYNANMSGLDHPWNDTALIAAVQKAGASTLRYPGGTIGNAWDWTLGGIDQSLDPKYFVDWMRSQNLQRSRNRYPPENVAKLYQATGIVPVWMLNVVTSTLEKQVAALEHVEKAGLPVRYIELGNELYFSEPYTVKAFPTPEDYGRRMTGWIEVLKKRFPKAEFAVVAGETRRPSPRSKDWTMRVVSSVRGADAVTVHIYSMNGLTSREDLRSPDRGKREYELLRTGGGAANVIAMAFAATAELERTHLPPGMKIWLTEWNLRGEGGAVHGSWAHGLYCAAFLSRLLSDHRVSLSQYHNLVGGGFPAILVRPGAYSKRGYAEVDNPPYALTAAGVVHGIFRRAMNGAAEAEQLAFGGAPEVRTPEAGYPSLLGWRFGNRMLLLNLSARVLRAGGVSPGRFTQWKADPAVYVVNEDSLNPAEGHAGATFDLAPYSITLVEGGRR